MYRKLAIDHGRLVRLAGRGLSDRAIARVLGCCRATVLNHRAALGLSSMYGRHITRRAQEAELNRLWGRLSLEEKIALLVNGKHRRDAEKASQESETRILISSAALR